MKSFLALAAMALSVGACQLPLAVPAPSSVAEATKLDEQAAITAELGYKLFRTAAELGVNAGVIKGDRANKVAALDNRLYTGLQTVRAAYATGNAATYSSAILEFNALLATGNALVGSN